MENVDLSQYETEEVMYEEGVVSKCCSEPIRAGFGVCSGCKQMCEYSEE